MVEENLGLLVGIFFFGGLIGVIVGWLTGMYVALREVEHDD